MKRTILFLLVIIAISLASCGTKTAGKDNQDSTIVATKFEVPNPVTEFVYKEGDKSLGISAHIENGKAYVTVDENKVMQINYGDYRLNDATNVVNDVDVPVLSVFIGDIGQDYNPVLCMIRADGKVQISTLFNGIRIHGGFYASYPLPGLDNIVAFEARNFSEYMGIVAIDANGVEKEIPYNPVSGRSYSYNDNAGHIHTVLLTSDWKISYRLTRLDRNGAVDGVEEYTGEYTSGFEGGDIDKNIITYTFHKKQNMLEENSRKQTVNESGFFEFNLVDFASGAEFVLKKGDAIQIAQGKKVVFKLDDEM